MTWCMKCNRVLECRHTKEETVESILLQEPMSGYRRMENDDLVLLVMI